MRQTQLFTKTRKESPKDEVSKNADYLIRSGFINKDMAGVYSLLPLGFRVVNKIEEVIRRAMNQVGGSEVYLSHLQNKATWEASGRWSDDVMDIWFKTELKNGTELGLGLTHEEPLTLIMKDHIRSYKDLPVYPYQFQTKFRNELRAKSGIMRGREFLMKDLYSFSKDEQQHLDFYEKMKGAYKQIFDEVGIGDVTYLTFASGGSFSDFSHEFQMITEAGEDSIFVDEEKRIAVNKEVNTTEVLDKLELDSENLIEKKAVEVGNIFTLGTKFSDALECQFTDEDGSMKAPFMGSYGIGIGRLMGAVVERYLSDDGQKMFWPKEIAPFAVHIIKLGEDETITKVSEDIYDSIKSAGIEVIYDDRDARPGEKLADADLFGVPVRIIVGKKSVENGKIEIVNIQSGNLTEVPYSDIIEGNFEVIHG